MGVIMEMCRKLVWLLHSVSQEKYRLSATTVEAVKISNADIENLWLILLT